MRHLLAFFLCALTAHFPAVAQQDVDPHDIAPGYKVEQSYEKAKFYSPNNLLPVSQQDFISQNPVNVVIHMHGCTGLSKDEENWANFLKSNGFFVVTPDSFAIEGREINCDPTNFVKNLGKAQIYQLRVAEFVYASIELRKIKSIKKIFVMGHSEGGGVVTNPGMRRFDGVISIGSFCNNTVGIYKSVPLLNINHKSDPFFTSTEPYACVEKTKYRADNTTNILLDGKGHTASNDEVAKAAVLDFLRKHTN